LSAPLGSATIGGVTDPREPASASPRPWRALLLVGIALVGVAIATVGVVALARGPLAFGWFAYAPVSDVTVQLNPVWRWAPYLVGAGALVVGGVAGFALGRRRTPR
jgi:heme/copper-type cytochrome/quinol oxidase subunit 1